MSHERSTNAVDKKLGERVRARRLEIGMSQERLAELVGVTFQQVQKYEKSVNRIAASRLFEVARALEMPPAQLFDGLSSSPKGGVTRAQRSPIQEALTTPEGIQLMALFANIKSTKVRRRVLELIRSLVGAGD